MTIFFFINFLCVFYKVIINRLKKIYLIIPTGIKNFLNLVF